MNLSEIFCQDRAIDTLQRAYLCGRLPHAYIFAGADGVGKFSTACGWSKLLLCKSPVKQKGSTESCGKCDSCRNFEADCHPDFHHVYKELIRYIGPETNKEKTPLEMPIDVVREFLINKIQVKPSLSAAKVFIISEAEKLNASSQNILLKVLEEPPAESFIILLCTKLDNLLPTTRSRCQIIRFGPVSEEKIITHLAGDGIDKNEARFWARLSGGSIGQAEVFSKLEPSLYGIKKQLVDRVCSLSAADCVDFAQWLNSAASQSAQSWQKLKTQTSKSDINRQVRKILVLIFVSAIDDAMKQILAETGEMINFDQAEQIKLLAQRYNLQQCAELIEDCFLTNRFIDASVNEKLAFEHMLLNFSNSVMMAV